MGTTLLDGLVLDAQRVLFDAEAYRPVSGGSVPEAFYDDGWVLVPEVEDVRDALERSTSILGGLDGSRLGAHASYLGRLCLAKADRLPTCVPVIQESFQALHFDMGLPLVDRETQAGYFFTMLYVPAESEPVGAVTRLVRVDRLLGQRSHGTVADCGRRLRRYAAEHGDGWLHPRRHITGRLGCLARVVDAMLDPAELAGDFDRGTWEWFRTDAASADGSVEHTNESGWWARHGYSLADVETRIRLRPGDLLLFDNVRCAHGRLGSRSPEELWQIMWGVPSVRPVEIAAIRRHLAAALAACP